MKNMLDIYLLLEHYDLTIKHLFLTKKKSFKRVFIHYFYVCVLLKTLSSRDTAKYSTSKEKC